MKAKIPVIYNIDVKQAGSLELLFENMGRSIIDDITITGYLNGDDIKFLRSILSSDEISVCKKVNLSSAKIVEGGGCYFRNYHTRDKHIGVMMFANCGKIENIYLPEDIVEIHDNAFWNCDNLFSVLIPQGTQLIGDGVFSSCKRLRYINIPDGILRIGEATFNNCFYLTITIGKAKINQSIKKVFSYCVVKNINVSSENIYYEYFDGVLYDRNTKEILLSTITMPENYVVPNGVTEIKCGDIKSNISSITLATSVTNIDDYAFSECENLTSIQIPSSVKRIGHNAFLNCTQLETILFVDNSLEFIGGRAFDNTAWLKKQEDGLVYIGNVLYCYKGKMNTASSLTLKDGVKSITCSAFEFCNNLLRITIPESVIHIGAAVFWWCTGLTSITLPNSLKEIGSNAFFSCSNLKSIHIGNSIQMIGEGAFWNCDNLVEIYMCSFNPPLFLGETEEYGLGIDVDKCHLYVPKGSYGLYRIAKGWKCFRHIIEI